MNEQEEIDSLNMKKKEEKVRELKTYSKPDVIRLGSMQKITLLSASPGFDDSNGTNIAAYRD